MLLQKDSKRRKEKEAECNLGTICARAIANVSICTCCLEMGSERIICTHALYNPQVGRMTKHKKHCRGNSFKKGKIRKK